MISEDGERTICDKSFSVRPREKPEDYVYTETEHFHFNAKLDRNLGEANAGKILIVGDSGNIHPIKLEDIMEDGTIECTDSSVYNAKSVDEFPEVGDVNKLYKVENGALYQWNSEEFEYKPFANILIESEKGVIINGGNSSGF